VALEKKRAEAQFRITKAVVDKVKQILIDEIQFVFDS